jgi:hypothetical protein
MCCQYSFVTVCCGVFPVARKQTYNAIFQRWLTNVTTNLLCLICLLVPCSLWGTEMIISILQHWLGSNVLHVHTVSCHQHTRNKRNAVADPEFDERPVALASPLGLPTRLYRSMTAATLQQCTGLRHPDFTSNYMIWSRNWIHIQALSYMFESYDLTVSPDWYVVSQDRHQRPASNSGKVIRLHKPTAEAGSSRIVVLVSRLLYIW